MKLITTLALILSSLISFCQKKTYLYSIADTKPSSRYSFYLVNAKGDTVTKLRRDKYFILFTDSAQKFFVTGIQGQKSWKAIDKDEKILFQVYNESYGEPAPDNLRNGLIRMVDNSGKIGFANEMGKVVIKPQFDYATSFDRKHAIIAMDCKLLFHEQENEGCEHPSLDCKQWGYIDKKGKIIMIGRYSFDDIFKKIKWETDED